MASWAAGRLQDPGYKRFILAGLAWDWLCQQLEPYLMSEIQVIHTDLITNGHTKPTCHTNASTYKQVKACPKMSCGPSVKFLDGLHSSGSVHLGWKNSHIELWETHPWSLALMYMNQGQNPTTNTGADKTDISGILNLMTHCNKFRVNRTLVEKTQQYRNQLIHHTPTFQVEESDFADFIDVLEKLLFDPCVAGYVTGNLVQQYLDSVKKMKMDVTFHDEITVIKQLLGKIEASQAQHWEKFFNRYDDLKNIILESIDRHDNNKNVTSTLITNQEALKKEMSDSIDKQDDLKTVMSESIDKQDDLKQVMSESIDKQDDLKKEMSESIHRQDDLQRTLSKLVDKQDDLKKVISESIDKQDDLTKVMLESINKQDDLKNVIKQTCLVRKENNPHKVMTTITQDTTTETGPFHDLQQELINCYSRPDYTQLNPLVDDDDSFGFFIESVFVEVSLTKREIKPILGKRGIEDLQRQKGTPVKNISDMIPPPGHGQRYLLTGFVGSGKSSLCLHWIHEWTTCLQDKVQRSTSNIHLYDLVIFLRARALETNILQSLTNVLKGKSEGSQTIGTTIRNAFAIKSNTLILIDGYDEANTYQKAIVNDIVSHKQHAEASVVITSQPNFFYGKVNKWYDNCGFSKKQQTLFIKQFKRTILENQNENFNKFEQDFASHKNASNVFTSPMMAMTNCTMVAAGEEVNFDSRVKNYQQLTLFLAKRACFKSEGKITSDQITQSMPVFRKATYNQMLKQKTFQFSRNELLAYIPTDTLDNIVVRLGYMSVTKYILSYSTDIAYTFVHKSWAEFTAAMHVLSLPSSDRSIAVCQLFKSGPANVEVIRFAFGICIQYNHISSVPMFRSIVEMVIDKLDTKVETVRDEMEMIRAGFDENYNYEDIHHGSSYLLLLLADVDPCLLPTAVLWQLSRICAAVRRAEIEAATVGEKVEGEIDVSDADQCSAAYLYASLLLTAHRTKHSLHTVRQVRVLCDPKSPHSIVTHLTTIVAACAPQMTALTEVQLWGVVSATELGEVCSGLAASGVPCLTNLKLRGYSDLSDVGGSDLGPVVQVIRAAAQLRVLTLHWIHIGDKGQLSALCAAVEEATPQLVDLELVFCSVSAQQYKSILLPALQRRLTVRGKPLPRVRLVWGKEKGCGPAQEWDELEKSLIEVSVRVKVLHEYN